MTDKLDYALDLMRRLPPQKVEDNLQMLIDLCPDLTDELLSATDQPLKIVEDTQEKRSFLICDYCRDGDSYRSPFSNTYFPPFPEGNKPSAELRNLEKDLNEAFNMYREMYYEGGVHSVYVWENDNDGFAVCVLMKKTADQSKKGNPMKGTWDSINVIEVIPKGKDKAEYRLTSTVILYLETNTEATGKVSFAGSLTRQNEKTLNVVGKDAHVVNIGEFVESTESTMRRILDAIYFSKLKEITNNCRCQMGSSQQAKINDITKAINTQLRGRKDD
uniref:F-actin-capping protein subunit beta n=1 Tax=Entamoeba invadens TaxID=33085 RepID=S0B4J4_ENTIV|nr:F-actin-capping protein subunit beta, putative [Entamoeba invadens]